MYPVGLWGLVPHGQVRYLHLPADAHMMFLSLNKAVGVNYDNLSYLEIVIHKLKRLSLFELSTGITKTHKSSLVAIVDERRVPLDTCVA